MNNKQLNCNLSQYNNNNKTGSEATPLLKQPGRKKKIWYPKKNEVKILYKKKNSKKC